MANGRLSEVNHGQVYHVARGSCCCSYWEVVAVSARWHESRALCMRLRRAPWRCALVAWGQGPGRGGVEGGGHCSGRDAPVALTRTSLLLLALWPVHGG